MLPTPVMILPRPLMDMNGGGRTSKAGKEVAMQIQMVRIRGIPILIIQMVLILIGTITMG